VATGSIQWALLKTFNLVRVSGASKIIVFRVMKKLGSVKDPADLMCPVMALTAQTTFGTGDFAG
jgi:hypothetical protein